MGYATISEVEVFLAQALTSARPDTTFSRIDLINVGNVRDLNRIPDNVVEFFISTSDNQIDGILSQQYKTPLIKCVNGQWDLDADISEYNQIVEITDATALVEGDEIVIRDDALNIEEYHTVSQKLDQYSFLTSEPILTNFTGSGIRVVRLQFPPPINQISAKFAASYIYDKYFAAQNSPNVSEYGESMRRSAIGDINNILNGKSILKCQRRVGDRVGNPWLDSAYSHRTPVDGYNTTDRDMSRPQ